MIRAGLVLLMLLLSSAAHAEPLTFGAINGTDDISRNTEIGRCAPDGGNCTLARTSFGGLPVARSALTLNPLGRVRTVEIALDAADFELARQMLAGRYGAPASAQGVSRWARFDDGAGVAIRRTPANTLVSFDYPANAAAATEPGNDFPWPLLLLVGLGLAAGFGVYRAIEGRRAKPALAAPQPSMRATLERRVRQGDGLTF